MEKTLKTEQLDSTISHADPYINTPLYNSQNSLC